MENEDNTEQTLGGESHMNSAPVEAAVDNAPQSGSQPTSQPEALSLQELNTFLGKDFKDKATALKAVKDTFSYVGKKIEDVAREISPDTKRLESELKQIKENMFYKDNPQLAEHRALLSKLNENPEVAVQMPEFKTIFEKAKGYDESQQLRTVLESNPRIQSSRDNLSQAREAMKAGNKELAETHAARAVLDLLDN